MLLSPLLSCAICCVPVTSELYLLCDCVSRHRVRLNTLSLLLQRGADPNIPKVPMPVLFLAVMAADTEAVRQLLLCGARTDIPLPPEVGTHIFTAPTK